MPPRKDRINSICAICGKAFGVLESEAKNGRGKYCSKECLGKSKRHGSILYCDLCDSPFYRRFGEQDVGVAKNQFCSRYCYYDWRQKDMKDSTYLKFKGRHIHRMIAEEYLKRELSPDEIVHHKDLNKKNNDPCNLAVFPNQSFHARCHFGEMTDDELKTFSLIQ